MTQRIDVEIIGRRTFLLGAGATLAIATFLANLPALAQEPIRSLDEALKKVLGDAKPVESGITLEVPEIAENGNTVPFALAVDSPMTPESYVKTLHIFASGNPQVGRRQLHVHAGLRQGRRLEPDAPRPDAGHRRGG